MSQEYENKLAAFAEMTAIAAHYEVPEWTDRVKLFGNAIFKWDQDWVNTYMNAMRERDDMQILFFSLDSLSGDEQLNAVRLVLKVLEKCD